MFRFIGFTFLSCIFLIISCEGKNKQTNQELLEENVKTYFFIEDSVSVEVEIMDTIHANEVEDMLATTEKNLNLINRDLDTLSLMIDDKAYKKLELEEKLDRTILVGKNKYKDSLNLTTNALLDLKLKQALLASKKESFKQTNRVLLHFKRSVWANVAGYNVSVNFTRDGVEQAVEVMTDANYRIID